MRGVWLALRICLIYALLGPLVGLIVFGIGVGVMGVASGVPSAGWLGPFFLIYGILFAHFIGLPWALLAGGAATVMCLAVGRSAGWIGPASGAVSFMVALPMGGAMLPPPPEPPSGVWIDGQGLGFAAVMAAVHILAAAASWALVRRLSPWPDRVQPPPAETVSRGD